MKRNDTHLELTAKALEAAFWLSLQPSLRGEADCRTRRATAPASRGR
ncbi:MAG: hypothetical protein ACM3ZA_08540 [Bacillota bacterium]